ncbi:het-domain-containing protein [Fusarium pseudocircinatum]|uniref:Het-domain-containing protein n=1 Tax=Fusarium pseudocircinatum TaxID=56676 RepID=A0A8H5KP05_9HYPO|nr:het-domain-containing protein [Fusarium pseudocircinatum]
MDVLMSIQPRLQDSMADWSIEGANMADYYGNALLTIAADTVPDTTASCFPKATSQPVFIRIADSPTTVKVAKIPLHVSMKSIRFDKNPPLCMPLFSRAWAFQERLIGTDLGEYWHDLIEMYLIRQLTFGSDKLNAIMGLAKQINISQNANSPPLGNYILGLWSSSLENALLWSKRGSGYSRNSQFPSWSWTSIGGTWLYQRPPPFPAFASKATILRTPPESWTIDPTREARSYRLVISGYAADAVLVPYNFSPGQNQVQWTLRTGFECDSDMELIVSLDIDLSYKQGDQATEVTCLQLGVSEIRSKRRSWGLVLRATTHKKAEFGRIGIMTASENWYDTISKRRNIELDSPTSASEFEPASRSSANGDVLEKYRFAMTQLALG